MLVRPSDATTVTVSLARSVRNPALEELYFLGPHPGNFAFEVGNADLDAERALGIDVAFRWRLPHVTGEVTWFRNRIDDYVFRRPTGEIEEDLPVVEFSADKAMLQGAEAHGDIELGTRVVLEVGADYVRGELRETGEPLPRIPPLRTTIGARYRVNALQMGAQVVVTADQTRVYGDETPTDGSAVLKLYGVYSTPDQGRPAHDHAAPRQRDQRDLPEPPLLHQGPGGRARARAQTDLRRPVLAGVCLRPRPALVVERAVRS